jgi:pectate lyase
MTIGTTCSGQAEDQTPVLRVNDGGHIRNLRINQFAADGIHCLGSCTLENVVWEDVCEDAATMLGGTGKTMTIIGGSASHAEDKVFQHNGKGTSSSPSLVRITGGFQTFGSIGKLWQSCGNCSSNGGVRAVDVNNVQLNGTFSSYLLRLNRNYGDHATVRNLRINDYSAGNPQVCVEAQGVQPGEPQSNFGEFWETAFCDIRRSDVTAF